MTLPELPAVVVFKDGGYFTYDGECCVPVSSSTFVQLIIKKRHKKLIKEPAGCRCVLLLVFVSSFLSYSSCFLSLCPCSFPIPAAVLSSSSPHWVMVCLAHHKAPGALPTIVCAVRPVMSWRFCLWADVHSRPGWMGVRDHSLSRARKRTHRHLKLRIESVKQP